MTGSVTRKGVLILNIGPGLSGFCNLAAGQTLRMALKEVYTANDDRIAQLNGLLECGDCKSSRAGEGQI